ncbi:MAG: phosphoribosylanthranilate isomerase [Atopobiaceae bacterium]|nr:phosphoribosylanthranilate isomerase [Atopobiaceae bacterium]
MNHATHHKPSFARDLIADNNTRESASLEPNPANRTRVKLCGMFRPEDVEAVNDIRPDYVGFVVDFPRSHRSVSAEELPALTSRVAQDITRVGVFVDEPVEVVARLFAQGAIDVAQLHGREDEAYIAQLRAACAVPIVQAFRVCKPSDVARAEASTANLVLLDNGQGTGETFDWSLVQQVRRPFVLAGGLSASNVATAIEATHPWAVDMSSGIETGGLKDPAKMRAAVLAVRADDADE